MSMAMHEQISEPDGPEDNRIGDVVVIGGCGHVGLPFGVALASTGRTVTLLDVDSTGVERVNSGKVVYADPGLAEMLGEVRAAGRLRATVDPRCLRSAGVVVVTVGTPVTHRLEPDLLAVPRVLQQYLTHLTGEQLIVIRSTLHVGGTKLVERTLRNHGVEADIAFCPDRSAEGHALQETFELPQLIAARTPSARARCRELFGPLTDRLVEVEPEEAELAKLVGNAWRYLKFAAANQFWMIATQLGMDYRQVHRAITHGYARAEDLPGPGFAAGPCLPKDAMLLAASSSTGFPLGQAALLVNDGLTRYLVEHLAGQHDLASMTVGILGMAFKGESNDVRDSCAVVLNDALVARGARVLCSDVYIEDPAFVTTTELLEKSDLVVVAAPHAAYRDLSTDKPLVDIWGITGGRTTIPSLDHDG